MQKARRHSITELRPLVSVWFQVLFSPSCSEYFSPFLHSTGSLSVSQEYLALPDGAGKFLQGVSDPAVLRILLGIIYMSYTGLSPSMVGLSKPVLLYKLSPHCSPTTPLRP